MEEEAYYINIREPLETRRRLLEASRQVVMCLQRYENFKLKKIKKENYLGVLRRNFKEINELIARLKKELPQIKVRKKPVTQYVAEIKKTPLKAAKAKRGLTELERELNEIEAKLSALK